MIESYRELFRTRGAGRAYDEGQYAPNSYWDLLWAMERPLLDQIASEMALRGHAISYLDFACGTGRILAHLEGGFERSTGIDVSEEMLGRARERTKRSRLVRTDITTGVEGGEVYDLITAFRFLLNAESGLRSQALRSLAIRLRGPESVLVVNCHGNPWSFKLMAMPVKWLVARLLRRPVENYLTNRQVHRLLTEAGLEVVSIHGFGFLPWRAYAVMPRRLVLAAERLLSGTPLLARLGVNQVFVCRLRRG